MTRFIEKTDVMKDENYYNVQFFFKNRAIIWKSGTKIQYLRIDENNQISEHTLNLAIEEKGIYFAGFNDPGDDTSIIMRLSVESNMQILVWDLVTNTEITNFSGEYYKDHYTGPNSKYGYCGFEGFDVNLDTGVPVPNPGRNEANYQQYPQGYKFNKEETVLLVNQKIFIGSRFTDIFFKGQATYNTPNSFRAASFNINHETALHMYASDLEKLNQILEVFEESEQPMYFAFILLRNRKGKSPLDIALDQESPRCVEAMLLSLANLNHLHISRTVF